MQVEIDGEPVLAFPGPLGRKLDTYVSAEQALDTIRSIQNPVRRIVPLQQARARCDAAWIAIRDYAAAGNVGREVLQVELNRRGCTTFNYGLFTN